MDGRRKEKIKKERESKNTGDNSAYTVVSDCEKLRGPGGSV